MNYIFDFDGTLMDTSGVGDADVDIMMGNAAGCKTCAVTYGNGSITSLEAAHPDYIIDDFKKLPYVCEDM